MVVEFDGGRRGWVDSMFASFDEFWLRDMETQELVPGGAGAGDSGEDVRGFAAGELAFVGDWKRDLEITEAVEVPHEIVGDFMGPDGEAKLQHIAKLANTDVEIEEVEPDEDEDCPGPVRLLVGPGFPPDIHASVRRVRSLLVGRAQAGASGQAGRDGVGGPPSSAHAAASQKTGRRPWHRFWAAGDDARPAPPRRWTAPGPPRPLQPRPPQPTSWSADGFGTPVQPPKNRHADDFGAPGKGAHFDARGTKRPRPPPKPSPAHTAWVPPSLPAPPGLGAEDSGEGAAQDAGAAEETVFGPAPHAGLPDWTAHAGDQDVAAPHAGLPDWTAHAGDQDVDGGARERTVLEWATDQAQFAHLPVLPPGWIRVTSKSSGKVYHLNTVTGKTTYQAPTPASETPKPGLSTSWSSVLESEEMAFATPPTCSSGFLWESSAVAKETSGPSWPGGAGGATQAAEPAAANGEPPAAHDTKAQERTVLDWAVDQQRFAHLPVLPSGWIRILSKTSGKMYYMNTVSGKTTYSSPIDPSHH